MKKNFFLVFISAFVFSSIASGQCNIKRIHIETIFDFFSETVDLTNERRIDFTILDTLDSYQFNVDSFVIDINFSTPDSFVLNISKRNKLKQMYCWIPDIKHVQYAQHIDFEKQSSSIVATYYYVPVETGRVIYYINGEIVRSVNENIIFIDPCGN